MRIIFALLFLLTVLCGSAQGTATSPEVLTEGTHTVAIDEYGYRQYFYYSYTSETEDRLLTIILPSANATVTATYTGGDPYQSDFPTYCVGNESSFTTTFSCLAPKGKTIYLKVTLMVLAFPEGTTYAQITVDSKPYEANNGQDPSKPIVAADGTTLYLPLEVDTEAPFLPIATYVAYTVEHDGWLYLNFTPSITSVYYRLLPEENYTYLKADYILENGKTVGSKTFLEVKKGQQLMFEIKGFNGAMLTTTLENPDPGTSCDFPLEIENQGLIMIPDAPGDYYWSFTPPHEGNLKLTSDMPLTNGYIEVMMDCNHTGSFTIYDTLWLRAWVYDRIDYIIHLKKDNSSEGAQFNLELENPLPCDKRYSAENLESGKEYTTPPFAGTYYYRIAPDNVSRDIKLNTLTGNLDSRTRVNFYTEDAPGETLARGLDMTYTMQPEVAYILQWTVFDNRIAIPFNVSITPIESGIDEIDSNDCHWSLNGNVVVISAENEKVVIYNADGKIVYDNTINGEINVTLSQGVYIISTGDKTGKIIIK